jgi:hypothetical protein
MSRPSWSVSPEEGGGGAYNPKDIHVDLEKIMQQREHQIRWGQHVRQEQQVQTQGQAATLLSLSHDDQPMTIDGLEHTPATSIFPWTANSTSPSGIVPSPFNNSGMSNNMISNSLTTMLHHPYHNQTDNSDGNGLGNGSSHAVDPSLGSLVLGFDTMDSVPDGAKNEHLNSLLMQRAKRLGDCIPGGSVTLQGDGCDREVLNYLLDVLMPIRHLVKIEINM